MMNVPNSWAVVPIVDVLEPNQNGKPFQQGWSPQCENHAATEEEWGVLKTTAIQPGLFWDHENKQLPDGLEPRPHIEVREGDLLMTCAGPRARCGVVCLVGRTRSKLMMSGKMYRFRPNVEVMDSRFLTYFIQSRSAQIAIDGMKTGISDSGLNLTHDRFAALAIPVAPPSEQRRVVAKIEELLSELDKGAESLTTAREQLKAYRQSVLKYALNGRLTAGFRSVHNAILKDASEFMVLIAAERAAKRERALRNWEDLSPLSRGQRPRNPVVVELSSDDISELEGLPDKWAWRSLSELADHITDGTHKTPNYTANGVPFLSAKDIYDFRTHFEDTRFISAAEHEELSKRCNVERGNVLITKSGTIGRVAVVDTDVTFSLFESVANVPVYNLMNPQFVCLAAYFVIETFFGRRNQKGVAVRHLHLEDIRRLPIPIMDRQEQDEIVRLVESIFSQVEQLENDIGKQFQRIEALRQSVLRQAFSGQLVPQDASDEPASALLERIRAEHEEESTNKRRNTKNGKKEAA